jgi:hypothetical protein
MDVPVSLQSARLMPYTDSLSQPSFLRATYGWPPNDEFSMRPGQLSAHADLGVSPLLFTVRTFRVKSGTSPIPGADRS